MAWHIGTASSCPSDSPYALISQDGTVAGCYPSREAANAGIAAMDVDEDGDGIGHQPSGVKTDLPNGDDDDPPPYAIPSGAVGIGYQTPWTKSPTMHTTPTTQVW